MHHHLPSQRHRPQAGGNFYDSRILKYGIFNHSGDSSLSPTRHRTKVVDLTTATAATATVTTADTVTEAVAADGAATYGRRIAIQNTHATATIGIAIGATTLADCIYRLEKQGDIFVADDWSEEKLDVISDENGATLIANVVNYKVL